MSIAKSIGTLLGTARALPHLLGYQLAKIVLGEARAFTAASERLAVIPGYIGIYTRMAFYKRVLDHVGPDCYFGFMSVFSKAGASIGARAYIGRFCSIGWAQIGDDALLADGVQVLSGRHQHDFIVPPEDGSASKSMPAFTKVRIGAGAWIGAGAIIMADVGEGAVVGAGAVVTKPVAAGQRVVGVPARPISQPMAVR